MLRKVWIGSVGPYLYDDTKSLNDAEFPAETMKALITNGQMRVTQAPTEDEHVTRLIDTNNAIAWAHLQNTDQYLDFGGAYQVSAQQIYTELDYASHTAQFNVTCTGFTAVIGGTCQYVQYGHAITLYLPDLLGTSNSDSMTIGPLPAGIVPNRRTDHIVRVQGQGTSTNESGLLVMLPGSSTMSVYSAIYPYAWPTSGTKGLNCTAISYVI